MVNQSTTQTRASPVGGQSRPGGPVLVTPGGVPVGTAAIPTAGGFSSARAALRAANERRAIAAARKAAAAKKAAIEKAAAKKAAIEKAAAKKAQLKKFEELETKTKVILKRRAQIFKKRISRPLVSTVTTIRKRITPIIQRIPKSKSKKLRTRQESLNRDVEIFNERFGGRELTEPQIKQARIISTKLSQEQRDIEKDTKKLATSTGTKVKRVIFGKPLNLEITESQKTRLKSDIRRLQGNIQKRKTQGKGTRTLESKLKSTRATLGEGKFKIIATAVPIGPAAGAAIAKGVSKIRFIGKQKTVGDKIITDIAFIQNGKRVGIATGATVVRGKKGVTVIAGKSGIPGIKFPSGKPAIKRIQSFISREIGVTKGTKFAVKDTVELLNKKKSLGEISVIRKNIDGLIQISGGSVSTVKGGKFVRTAIRAPSGKIIRKTVKAINKDTFASVSAIFSKKDLSLVIGKTITGKLDKAQFIGIIKGERGVKGLSSLSSGQQVQYQKALSKVISATSAALAKTNKLKGVSKNVKLITTAAILSPGKAPVKETTLAPKVKLIQKARQSLTAKQITRVQQNVKKDIKTATKLVTKLRSKSRSVARTKVSQKVKQKARQATKQATKQVTKLKQAQKLLKQQIQQQRLVTCLVACLVACLAFCLTF